MSSGELANQSFISQYRQASTVLSVGSIRQQFSIRGNIEMSLFSSAFIRDVANHLAVGNEGVSDEDYLPDVQFVNGAYLFLASEKGERILLENFKTQRYCVLVYQSFI